MTANYCTEHEECDAETCIYEDNYDEEEEDYLEESFRDFGFGSDGDRG